MSKEMISVAEITLDPCVKIIKAFRLANKRAGEAKRERNLPAYQECLAKLDTFMNQAKEKGFKIWVNANGKTGHTYTKDYRKTPDADNDYDAFMAAVRASMGGEPPEEE